MLYFLLYLFLEVVVSVNISSAIGGVMTFIEILLSAFVGISILMNFKTTFMANLQAVSFRCIDVEEFQRLNIFSLIGVIFLIVPGFLTDILGLLLQFSVFTSMIVNRYNVKSHSCNASYEDYENHKITKDSDVIDVEIISDSTTSK